MESSDCEDNAGPAVSCRHHHLAQGDALRRAQVHVLAVLDGPAGAAQLPVDQRTRAPLCSDMRSDFFGLHDLSSLCARGRSYAGSSAVG